MFWKRMLFYCSTKAIGGCVCVVLELTLCVVALHIINIVPRCTIPAPVGPLRVDCVAYCITPSPLVFAATCAPVDCCVDCRPHPFRHCASHCCCAIPGPETSSSRSLLCVLFPSPHICVYCCVNCRPRPRRRRSPGGDNLLSTSSSSASAPMSDDLSSPPQQRPRLRLSLQTTR